MNTLELSKTNRNFTIWEPVVATQNPFTPFNAKATTYRIFTPLIGGGITDFAVAPVLQNNIKAGSSLLDHSSMLSIAKKSVPDQSWYDEDFRNVRHPAR